jgi:RimJ/RimL family protein N-acetyltransferase
MIHKWGDTVLTFYDGKTHVGKIMYTVVPGSLDSIEISFYTIYRNYRGKSLGEEIHRVFNDAMKEKGIKRIILTAREDYERYGKLEKVYQSLGYVRLKEPKDKFHNGKLYREITMVKTL